jgi:hypothetical protein
MFSLPSRSSDAGPDIQPDTRDYLQLLNAFEEECRMGASNQEIRSYCMADAFHLAACIDHEMRGWCDGIKQFLGSENVLRELRLLAEQPSEDRWDALQQAAHSARHAANSSDWPERFQWWTLAKASLEQALEMKP